VSENHISQYLWPGKTSFGFGAAKLLAAEAADLGATAVFIITDPGVVAAGILNTISQTLDEAGLSWMSYERAQANPGIDSIHAATTAFRESGAQLIVGLGGGSVLDTGKAVKLKAGGPSDASIWEYATMLGEGQRPCPSRDAMPPYVAIPTTAGTGAEVTPWAVLTNEKRRMKFGVGTASTVPDVALVDPELTLSLPKHLTAATGMDALTHLVEAYVSTNHGPVLDPMILYGIELVGRNLRAAVARGDNRQARADVMQASMIGGIAISSKWLGACHSLAHPLSCLTDVHHGLACAITLPHQMAYSLIGAPGKYADVAVALDRNYAELDSEEERAYAAVTAVRELMTDIGLPLRLRDVGVQKEHIPALAKAAYTDLNWWTNPRQVSEEVMADLYRQAW
jgi:alcohol dehydrogenase class IV